MGVKFYRCERCKNVFSKVQNDRITPSATCCPRCGYKILEKMIWKLVPENSKKNIEVKK